jgi:hypothetical protein
MSSKSSSNSDNSSNDSSKVSSVSDSENISSQIKSKTSKNSKNDDKNLSNGFKEKIINYIKVDDLIRKKMDEVKELKDKKEECEEYILKFLDKSDATFVNIPGGKLIRNQSETKGTLKAETIKESIIEGIKKEKIANSEAENKKLIEDIMEIMEEKRGKVNRINLKRTFERSSKPKKTKK